MLVTGRELGWMNQERLELKMGTHNRSVMVTVYETPCIPLLDHLRSSFINGKDGMQEIT
jgi:hypothetical protein